ncbi:MAG TPA: DUF4352 domain-containing protein [Candidatus Acidoferrum sp.]|nr:DUF4352 domain-containing protein [Candidatus Acidoferrum sp.]
MKLRALALPVAALGVFLLTADTCNVSGGTPAGSIPTPGGTITVAVGRPMTDTNGESMTVAAFKASPVDPNGFETLPPGRQCVAITVTIKNGSSSEWIFPLSEVSVVDSTGQKCDALDVNSGACHSSDSIDSLVAGGHGTGTVYYAVPKAGALDVNWTPSDFSGQVFQTAVG